MPHESGPRASTSAEVGLRPPAQGRPVHAVDGVIPPATLFVVRYGDENYPFQDGSWGRFGRDDDTCQIPVWEEINDNRLSRVAGELWCADDEMWLRNLSTTHELTVIGGSGQQWLPRREHGERGAACSLSGAASKVTAASTGAWEILVDKVHRSARHNAYVDSPRTEGITVLPPDLVATAAALCAPILERDDPPATYDQIATTLGISRRQARRYVERLCAHYAGQYPVPEDDAQGASYAPLARLLVRRGRVTSEDVAAHLRT